MKTFLELAVSYLDRRLEKPPIGKISVGLMGGVGNMLFQIARGASLLRKGYRVSFFQVIPRSTFLYQALGWSRQPHWLDIPRIVSHLGMRIERTSVANTGRLGLSFLSRKQNAKYHIKFMDRPLGEVLTAPHGLDIGYFQTPNHISPEGISSLLAALAQQCYVNVQPLGVTVHMRGGDINADERLDILQIAKVLEILPIDQPVRVVGNDQKFIADLRAANLRPLEYPSGTAFSDFCTIAASERLILSSSTFGFWAAALANTDRRCPIHVQEGSLFTKFPDLFPDTALLPSFRTTAN